MRPGKDFEVLAERLFRILTAHSAGVEVQRDVELDGADGKRQVDLVVRSSVGPINLLTIVECKDHSRVVDVTKVDALHSVMQDVRASKAVLVARGGFSNRSSAADGRA